MKTATINTLLLITAARCWRADVAGGGVQGVWSVARRPGSALAEAVRTAQALGGAGGRSVLVLSTDVWTQTLTLHRGQVAGLTVDEVAQALAFEVEPFSGIPAVDSVIGACDNGALDGTAGYWATQALRGERAAVQKAVREYGSRFAGMGHPGGVPVPLGARKSAEAWRRVESWDGAMLMIACEDGRQVQTRVVSGFPDARQMPTHGHFETLHTQETPPLPREHEAISWQSFNLADESSLRAWFGAWAGCLLNDQGAAQVPLIAPEAPPPSSSAQLVAGAVFLAAAVLVIIAQMAWLGHRANELKASQAEFVSVSQQIESSGKQATGLRKQLEEAHMHGQTLERVATQRRALSLLLRELAARRTEDIVVRSIKSERGAMIVGGLALEAAAVDELGILLSQALKPAGLVAQTVEKKARRALVNQGPWDFSLAVMPVELAAKSAPLPQAVSDN